MNDAKAWADLGPSSFSRDNMLHKAIKENRADIVQLWFNVGPNTLVNAPNRWLQTPLHYLAMKFNTFLLEKLLAIPIADPKLQDINGFNVLHCYIYNILTPPLEDWKRIIEILFRMGIDVNQRTNYGYTVLHLACRYRTSSCVLRYLLESCHQVDKLVVNNDGENFLHTFVQSLNNGIAISEDFKEKFSLLEDIINEKISNLSLAILKSLLQQQNNNGATPFHLIISQFDKYRKVNAVDILWKMTSFTNCATKPDNLGNHPIHVAIACTPNATSSDLLKMLVKAGNKGDSRNIFQQTAAHLVRTNEGSLSFEKIKSLRSLKKIAKVVFNSQDKWLSTPLMNISANCDSNCYYTLNEISDSFLNVNARDENGATALHYAAYHDSAEFSDWLIEKSAKTDIKDKLGDTPLDTARRHLNFITEKVILKSKESEVLYNIDQDFINDVAGLRRMKPIHMNADDFIDRLLQEKYRQALVSDEDRLITDTIHYFIKMLCSKVEKYDPRFRISLLQSGSTSEGTKVGPPDEFDFLLCLDAFSEITEIVQQKRSGNHHNVALKLKVAESSFLEYFDEEGVFTTSAVFAHLDKYLTKAMHEISLWEDGKLRHLSYVFELPLLKKDMVTTVFMSHLIWMGCRHKNCRIKIDMVPVIRKKAWWPIDPWSLPLMSRDIYDAGCLLMLDTKDELERFTSDFMKETILGSINHMEPLLTDLSVSSAPAEICLMRSLPVVVRESYALAKLLAKFCEEDDVTSYMLKNCVFYVLWDLGWNAKNPDVFESSLGVREITILVLKKLLTFNKKRFLPRFFVPNINIFDEDDDDIEQRRRSVNSLLIILGVDVSLNTLVYQSDDDDFSEDNSNDDSDID